MVVLACFDIVSFLDGRLYISLLYATGQLACDVDNELSGFGGHHLVAKFAIFI